MGATETCMIDQRMQPRMGMNPRETFHVRYPIFRRDIP